MHQKTVLLALFLMAFGAVALGQAEQDWKKVENRYFSFSIPTSLKKTRTRGFDSFVEEYVSKEMGLSFDYGIYSNNFQDWPRETALEVLKIDGRAARIGTAKMELRKGFPYTTQVYIKLHLEITLSMRVECRSEKEVAIARKIFLSLAFKPSQ